MHLNQVYPECHILVLRAENFLLQNLKPFEIKHCYMISLFLLKKQKQTHKEPIDYGFGYENIFICSKICSCTVEMKEVLLALLLKLVSHLKSKGHINKI